ncbi:MAG: trypsin-like peptidase domain-containing protein [Deltaproteobacteria bacterium]|nr:trypsin-like peptidase domain-containing protein [Deltaproteobacteria bacterium]
MFRKTENFHKNTFKFIRKAAVLFCLGVAVISCEEMDDDGLLEEYEDFDYLAAAFSDPESQCGPDWDVQDVERYDGTAGVSIDWVRRHESPVGMLTRGCTGTLISNDLFISAGHCGYAVGDTIRFDYQRDPASNLRATFDYSVSAVVEQEDNDDWDYAIVRLANNPGKDFGYARIANLDSPTGSLVGIIQHPAAQPKGIHAATVVDYNSSLGANWFRHSVDTTNGSSGSGVLNEAGYLVGIHTNAGCATGTPEEGNSAIRMSRLIEHSATLQRIVKHVYVATPRSWTDANADCANRGGHLVTIEDAAENSLVNDIMQAQGTSRVWLGYTDEGHEGEWRWVTGEPAAYTNWNSSEPNNAGGNEHYAEMSLYSARWNDLPNTWTMPYICEFGDYEVMPQLVSWTSAYNDCIDRGAHLVSIGSAEENALVQRIASQGTSASRIWIGYSDEGHEGTWRWTSGESTGYTSWSSGEPNNAGTGENHAELYLSSGNWNDLPDSYSASYVCELSKYRYFRRTRTWQESRVACESMGARLVSVSHADENSLLQRFAGNTNDLWLGLTDEAQEGTWRWHSGESLSYTNWNSGEPNDAGGNEDYTELYVSSGRWNDLPNDSNLSAICEKY